MRIQSRQKPFFSKEQLDKIEDVFRDSMNEEHLKHNDEFVAAVRKYANSPKNMYENALLHGVIDGKYRFIVRDGHATWQTKLPHNKNPETLEAFQKAEDNLKHAIGLVALYGSKNAGRVDYEELPERPLAGFLPSEVAEQAAQPPEAVPAEVTNV